MSALVGYESSSDEEEVPIPKAPTGSERNRKPVGSTVVEPRGQSSNEELAPPSNWISGASAVSADVGPMLGPSMPEHMGSDAEQDPLSELQQSMSERDIIHHLTAASHPMTSLPPSPPGSPNPALEAKFKKFVELKAKGVHFNEDLARKATFRNPSLLPTLMVRVGLEEDDQYRTSLSQEVWDPSAFPPSVYKEALLRSQQSLREQEAANKKSLSASGRRTIEFTSGGTSGNTSRDSTPGMPNKRRRP
ncbi:hypothetical protein LTR67_010027 [Exophiala xenobiotica]